MLTHVVMMKLVDRADAAKAKELLDGLAGRVPTLRSVTAGVDTLAATPNSWDLLLVTTHDDADGLRAYQAHAAHQEVVDWLGSRIATRAIVDY